MYVITLKDHPQGIYSVFDKDDKRIVPLFTEQDDAVRYVMALAEDEENPELQVLETEPDQIIHACRSQGQRFSIITGDDLIVPPDAVVKVE
tara:strand:+ start:286 stop:558 length:273 start_codon:yes stop_codon:yes gene_type:complete